MKNILIIITLATAVLASCSNEEPELDNCENYLKIHVAGIGTKAVQSEFVNNDSIKVFITGTGYTPALTTFKYSSPSWVVGGPNKNIMLSNNNATVYAYYPATITPSALSSTGTLPVSIPATDDLRATATKDVLWATPVSSVNSSVDGTSNLATLQFNHALAKISFIITKDVSYSSSPTTGVVNWISLTSQGNRIVNVGTVKLSTGAFSAGSPTVGSIVYTPSSTTYINQTGFSAVTAYALVAPVNYANGDLVLNIAIDGRVMTVTNFPSTPDWSAASVNYKYMITVKPAI